MMKKPSKSTQMLRRARRILKHPSLDLLIAPLADPSLNHLIIITPAAIGTAVQRNTIRRRIKALFHEERLLDRGFNIIVIVKKGESIVLTMNYTI